MGNQRHYVNYKNKTPGDNYRLSVFIPFHDYFISHLHDRLLKHKNILAKIENMRPIEIIISLSNNEKIIHANTLQRPDIVNPKLIVEVEMGKR